MGVQRLAWDDADGMPSSASVEARLRREGVTPYAWSNAPGDRYAPHSHGYTKLLMCAAGSIRFLLDDDEVELQAGDGLVLAPNTGHAAMVGPRGCTCLEGHR